MKVDNGYKIGGTTRSQPKAGARTSPSSSFADALASSGRPQGAAGAGAMTGLSAVLMAQSVDGDLDPQSRKRRRVVRQGHDVLDALEWLQDALLRETVTPEVLARMKASIARLSDEDVDPDLRPLLDDIRLRAEIEIAKIECSLKD